MIDQIIEMKKRMPELDDIHKQRLHLERKSNESKGYGFVTNKDISDRAYDREQYIRQQNNEIIANMQRRQNRGETNLEMADRWGMPTADTSPGITPVFNFQNPDSYYVAQLSQIQRNKGYGGKSKRVRRVKRSKRSKCKRSSTKRRKQ